MSVEEQRILVSTISERGSNLDFYPLQKFYAKFKDSYTTCFCFFQLDVKDFYFILFDYFL